MNQKDVSVGLDNCIIIIKYDHSIYNIMKIVQFEDQVQTKLFSINNSKYNSDKNIIKGFLYKII